MIRDAVLIAGPTASGKSAAALELARRENRVVVNTDAMQVYRGLRILTAQPDKAERAAAPHLLYGHADPFANYSVAAWAAEVGRLAAEGAFDGRRPIFVGGTGLYFKALCEGLAAIPEIPASIRLLWRARMAAEGPGALHRVLAEEDPETAARLQPRDGQRIARALEVLHATGRPISIWQAAGGKPLIDAAGARKFIIEPDRTELVERIDSRFRSMVEQGALNEVRRIGEQAFDPAVPSAKAIGLRELRAVAEGTVPLEEGIRRAVVATRRFAKRQATWFRHQFGADWRRISSPEELLDKAAMQSSTHA